MCYSIHTKTDEKKNAVRSVFAVALLVLIDSGTSVLAAPFSFFFFILILDKRHADAISNSNRTFVFLILNTRSASVNVLFSFEIPKFQLNSRMNEWIHLNLILFAINRVLNYEVYLCIRGQLFFLFCKNINKRSTNRIPFHLHVNKWSHALHSECTDSEWNIIRIWIFAFSLFCQFNCFWFCCNMIPLSIQFVFSFVHILCLFFEDSINTFASQSVDNAHKSIILCFRFHSW